MIHLCIAKIELKRSDKAAIDGGWLIRLYAVDVDGNEEDWGFYNPMGILWFIIDGNENTDVII